MSERAALVADALAQPDPAALYRALLSLNGTLQNMVLRRLDGARLGALRAYAETQPPSPLATTNGIAFGARLEQRRRTR